MSGTVGYGFKCNENYGALLILNDNDHRLHCFPNVMIPRYMALYYKTWCQFAKSMSLKIDDPTFEDLVLIRGWIKTSKWSVVTWLSGGTSHDLIVKLGVEKHADVGVTFSAFHDTRDKGK